ncbi:hypothetical protein QC456_004152 [Bacillus cereus]|nr:hypothetical protein [Bacillus cereus]MBG9491820.1 hypothetical protein [Bacillus thuringiensis]MBG9506646.1 hypothetical protein [Bacillus thuringiensis]MBG9510944.1 hypothetical protein [Bacillus thuringiensis]PFE43550.1 hypothetical protein CN312_18415 [Bacillus thuringiensis]
MKTNAAQLLRQNTQETFAYEIAEEFRQFLETWHSYSEPYDTSLDIWLHESYAKVLSKGSYLDYRSLPYFSPSSANSCPRELYEKALRSPRDQAEVKPWQRRWQFIGTNIGDAIQRDILLAERHYEKFTSEKPRFRIERTKDGYPAFEDFVKTRKVIEHNDQQFALIGTCDGILEYTDEHGVITRVGLEIKSKQTTYSKTSEYSLREPGADHVKQVTCYSLMYDLDYYIVLYMNASKKAWNMNEEDYAKYPDFRAFGVAITDDMRNEVLDKFASIVAAVNTKQPPKLDIEHWLFNNYKTACAQSLSDEEYEEIKTQVSRVKRSSLSDTKKAPYIGALEFIDKVREGMY